LGSGGKVKALLVFESYFGLVYNFFSYEELLLSQRQVKPEYNYFFSAGLNYSFWFTFNTLVNPRFNF